MGDNQQTTPLKICTKCMLEKPIDDFYRRNGAPIARCRACTVSSITAHSLMRKGTKKEYDKTYRERNKLKISARRKAFRSKNRDRIVQSKKIYRLNPENKKKRNQKEATRRRNDPEYLLTVYLRNRIRESLNRQDTGKDKRTLELLGESPKVVNARIQYMFPSGMGWTLSGPGRRLWHLDHIRPIDSFDLSDPEQLKICFHYTNLQPLSTTDNLLKGAEYSPQKYTNAWVVSGGYTWRLCDNVRYKLPPTKEPTCL
jgi:hypothetical protein